MHDRELVRMDEHYRWVSPPITPAEADPEIAREQCKDAAQALAEIPVSLVVLRASGDGGA